MLDALHLDIRVAGKTLCRDLCVTARAGENWAILGANGSGKTTLLHTLAGLRAADGGAVRLDRRDLRVVPRHERARRLGIVFQDMDEHFPATVLETVLTGRHPHLARWQWEGVDDLHIAQAALAAVDLAGFASRALDTLSGGERRRVAIATLLAQDPPVCLLDEPNNHLDLRHQQQILALLGARAQRAGHLNIFTLHDVNLAVRFCTHALLLFDDGVGLHGAVAEVITPETLTRLYACPIREIRDSRGSLYVPAPT